VVVVVYAMSDKPDVTFSGGLNITNPDDVMFELTSDYLGTADIEMEWVRDYNEDGDVGYWPQITVSTEYSRYTFSCVDEDSHNLEDFANWILQELEDGPDNRIYD